MPDWGGNARNDSVVGWITTHKFLAVVNVMAPLLGMGVAWYFLPEWPAWRSLLAGFIGGAGASYLFTCTRLVGGSID